LRARLCARLHRSSAWQRDPRCRGLAVRFPVQFLFGVPYQILPTIPGLRRRRGRAPCKVLRRADAWRLSL